MVEASTIEADVKSDEEVDRVNERIALVEAEVVKPKAVKPKTAKPKVIEPVVEPVSDPWFVEPMEANEAKRLVQRVKYATALREGTNAQLHWGSALSSVDREEVQAIVAEQVAEENA